MTRIPRMLHCLLAAALALVGLAACALPAAGFRGHAFEASFGEPCVLEPCVGGTFKEPSAVAVNDETGAVYVLDQGDGRVERFSAAGNYEVQFTGGATPAGSFAFGSLPLTAGIAVDNSCYFKHLSGAACSAADPSNGDVYVTDPRHEVLDKFTGQGVYLGQVEEVGGAPFKFETDMEVQKQLNGVSVDANGIVWAYGQQNAGNTNGVVFRFTTGEPNIFISSLVLNDSLVVGGGFMQPGFAVDSKDDLYTRELQELQEKARLHIVKWDSSGLSLGSFDPEETSAVAVDLANDEVLLDNVGSLGAFSPSGELAERFGAGHLQSGAGLAISHAGEALYGTGGTTVYVADAAAGHVVVFSPEPPGAPIVQGESVTGVTGESATLAAEVDPHGASTEYRFEYGPCATLAACATSPYTNSAPVPAEYAGSDFEEHRVSVHVQGLAVGTVYHFRVAAHNEAGHEPQTGLGEERTFTTQAAGDNLALADGRQWEMVSPPDKHGAVIYDLGVAPVAQSSLAGGAFTFTVSKPTEAGAAANGGAGVQVLAARGAGGGWASRDVATPHATAVVASQLGGEYKLFSPDLSSAVLQPQGEFTSLAPEVFPPDTERTPYLRHNSTCATEAGRCFEPLLTGCPAEVVECAAAVQAYADVPPGTAFGGEPGVDARGEVEFAGASPDLRHVILDTVGSVVSGKNVALTSAPVPHGGLYEWSATTPASDQVQLVSVLPNGTPAANAQLGAEGTRNVYNAVSADGSRVVFHEVQEGGHLYLRVNATQPQSEVSGGRCTEASKACTLQLDALQGGSGQGQVSATFETASSDGSRVFFTDRQRLTAGSGASTNSPDLYECRIVQAPGGEASCRLSDLTPLSGGGESANVWGMVGASEDGSVVYFVADGVVGDGGEHGALPGDCQSNGGGECNLYVARDGASSFITTLSGADHPDWSSELFAKVGRASPDGQWLAFLSQRSLTGYDNTDAASGGPDEEVYLYSLASGRIVCASCNPTGARPLGLSAVQIGESIVGNIHMWGEGASSIAATVPTYSSPFGLYQPRYLSDGGRLFFDSSDALVAQDINRNEDVYEYEPPGVGLCARSSSTFSERSDGCVSLISSGAYSGESAFLDASENGNDAFFLTGEKLVSQDVDTSPDVYDAHTCTGDAPCASAPAAPPPCVTADACRTVASPQPSVFGAPASAVFSGPGNRGGEPPVAAATGKRRPVTASARRLARALRMCAKLPSRRRGVCRRRARARYGHTAARSSARGSRKSTESRG